MMSQVSDVGDYVRKMGRESSAPVHVMEIAEALGMTKSAVASARTDLTRQADDIFPCAPSMMVYEPGWKGKHHEVWEEFQARSAALKDRRDSAISEATHRRNKKRPSGLPNVIGPVTTLHNVAAVNVHPAYVSVQHMDGTFTTLVGTVTLEEKKRNG